jgi:hypothetical protein
MFWADGSLVPFSRQNLHDAVASEPVNRAQTSDASPRLKRSKNPTISLHLAHHARPWTPGQVSNRNDLRQAFLPRNWRLNSSIAST